MQTTRRNLLTALAASGATLAATGQSGANPGTLDLSSLKKETDVACLYHCDFGDPRRFSQMLQNMLNHYSAYEFDSFKLKLVVVAHGAGLKFFLDDLSGTPFEKDTIDPEIDKRFVGLTKYGAEAYLCQIMDAARLHIRDMLYICLRRYVTQPRMRKAMRPARLLMLFTAAAMLVASAVVSPPASAAELLMYRRAGCSWCMTWDREIGAIYAKTDIGRRAPVRMVDLDGPRPAIALKGPVIYTPTFVLAEEGREMGRIEGYPGDHFFWGMLEKLAQRLP